MTVSTEHHAPVSLDATWHPSRVRPASAYGRTHTVKSDGTVVLPVGVRQPDFSKPSTAGFHGPHIHIDITTVEQAITHPKRTNPTDLTPTDRAAR